MRRAGLVALAAAAVLSCPSRAFGLARDEADIRARLQVYAPVRLQLDLAGLPAGEREAIPQLLRAVRALDAIYWKQLGPQSLEARAATADVADPLGALYRDFVGINYGPFDIRNDMERFLDTPTGGRPLPGAGFYPPDMTKEEFDERLRAHPDLRVSFERMNTVLRRVDGVLLAIPYEQLYRDDLEPAAEALRQAAQDVSSPSLRRYLSLRAAALLSGDYHASDVAWLEVKDNLIDAVLGPIETYQDRLLGLKAAYEGAVLVKDVRGSRALEVYLGQMDALQAALPVDETYRKGSPAKGNVLEVLNVVRFGGDFNAGIKTVAASLPNDERVIEERGAKKQIYRNVLEAKFDVILQPIAQALLAKKENVTVTREAFVANVLLHELSHTLGADYVSGHADLTVHKALRDRFGAVEEAKADVVGLWDLRTLRTQEIFGDDEVRQGDLTWLASLFRSVRFGTGEAHGLASAVQIGFLMHQGAILFDAKRGEFSLHEKRFDPALQALAKELLEIEGSGDYDRAGRFLKQYGTLDPVVREALRKIAAVPVDVTFTYPDVAPAPSS
jgi:hypothetical protein